ncbi:MAG: flagellar basal body rod protein FlgC [Gemmatimonadaceae bacterium]
MTGPIRPPDSRSPQRRMFGTLGVAASGLSAQRLRMETIAMNVANAETTRTEAGGPYRRRVVEMEANGETPFGGVLDAARVEPGAGSQGRASRAGEAAALVGGVRVIGIAEDPTEGPLVYEPGHPDANADGYVRYPNVRVTDEMVDLMDARRLYEANATVFQAAKAMLRRAIDI